MRDLHTIVLGPVITEKSTDATEGLNVYTFRVAPEANRIQVKAAVEAIFDVKVRKVNTLTQRGRRKRMGRAMGMTSGFKKALVTLQPGHKIDLF